MTQIVQLGNSDNWERLWETNIYAAKTSLRTYVPIPEIECPFLIDKFILNIYVSQTEGKDYWRFAGFLNQKLLGRLTVPGQAEFNAINKERLYLNRWMLFNFPKLTTDYTISFEIPFWFRDVDIKVYQYTGVNYDSILDEFTKTNNRILDNAFDLTILRNDVEDLLNR